MSTDAIFMGWNRSVPGREATSAEHFQEFLGYLGGLQQAGKIASFEPVLLNPHGGDLNGFVLIRGDSAQIDALSASEEWQIHITRGGFHLEGLGIVRGVTGEGVMAWMARWSQIASA
jgi:hypothetical protein